MKRYSDYDRSNLTPEKRAIALKEEETRKRIHCLRVTKSLRFLAEALEIETKLQEIGKIVEQSPSNEEMDKNGTWILIFTVTDIVPEIIKIERRGKNYLWWDTKKVTMYVNLTGASHPDLEFPDSINICGTDITMSKNLQENLQKARSAWNTYIREQTQLFLEQKRQIKDTNNDYLKSHIPFWKGQSRWD